VIVTDVRFSQKNDKRLLRDQDIELWKGGGLIARLPHKPATNSN
jgi:hypothetical protein